MTPQGGLLAVSIWSADSAGLVRQPTLRIPLRRSQQAAGSLAEAGEKASAVSVIQQLGRTVHDRHVQQHSASQGISFPGIPAGVIATPSGISPAVMQGLLGLQELSTASLPGTSDPAAMGFEARFGARMSTPPQFGTMAGTLSGFRTDDCKQYSGRSSGSGQCVALVQAALPGTGSTQDWACGDPVRGNVGLQAGTAIATFGSSGRYANATDGSSHAAVYLGQNEQGIQVLDQWSGSPAALRTIPWTNPSGVAANTGGMFHVVRSS